jgi:hypothetical protein
MMLESANLLILDEPTNHLGTFLCYFTCLKILYSS